MTERPEPTASGGRSAADRAPERVPTPAGPSVHRAAGVLAVGDELLTGQTLDSNSRWLAHRLGELGLRVVEHATVGDDAAAIAEAVRRLASRSDLVVLTGGLGPTADDLTRDALSVLTDDPLVVDERALESLRRLFADRGRELRDGNERQAMRPGRAVMLENDRGTAPGIRAVFASGDDRTDVVALPGPPFEMHAMFERFVTPTVRAEPGSAIRVRVARHVGLGESNAAAKLGDLLERDRNPIVGITASDGVISTRAVFRGPDSEAEAALDATDAVIRERIGAYRFAEGERTLFGALVDALVERGEALVLAESCTGGMIASRVTDVPGSSSALLAGWVCYSNAAKVELLGVSRELIEAPGPGAVSAGTASELAQGAVRRTPIGPIGSDRAGDAPKRIHALSVTGVAGPSGGSETKPVGTVFVGRATATLDPERSGAAGEDGAVDVDGMDVEVRRFHFPGDRTRVRERTAVASAAMLLAFLQGRVAGPLLWEVELDGSRPVERSGDARPG